MLSSSTELRQIFDFAPEWEQLLKNWDGKESTAAWDFLAKVGAKAIYMKALSLDKQQSAFVRLLRDQYYLPMFGKMLSANQNLRRFLGQRYVAYDEQKKHSLSMSVELAAKLEGVLLKQLSNKDENGFKVLLAPYIQRSVHNAVIDYIRLETTWERSTLQDVYLDPEQDDPRTNIADDQAYTPETLVASAEQVTQLNQLRQELTAMLKEPNLAQEPLIVLDCMFGLGLTPSSVVGQEMTMRECCEALGIEAETMQRRIARCQVLLDKGLDMVRQRVYKKLPGVAECWRKGLNINTASRRELGQLLGFTEGEVERLVKGRQFNTAQELVDKGVIKEPRLSEVTDRGAVAVFVPVELNSACARDLVDILGLSKDLAQKIVAERPFLSLADLSAKGLIEGKELDKLTERGAALKISNAQNKRFDLNKATLEEIQACGLDQTNATFLVKFRPFVTWSELEELLGPECTFWNVLRQKFFLGIGSS
ncbi:MAG: hypothetical protein K2W82_05120 [Candidatus Obscuribacterales bacterium]|nr:hypothetical protein [Candidatus Obscuribacterales bacterium]